VVTPIPGGPAEMAGIKAGDSIVLIGGKPTNGLSLYEASDLLLGDVGTQVIMTVQHNGTTKEYTLTRCGRICVSCGWGLMESQFWG